MKVSIGIDIGANGAWAMFLDEKLIYGKIPDTADELDMYSLKEIFHRTIMDNHKDKIEEVDGSFMRVWSKIKTHCVIEDLHSIFGSSAKANFQFGVNNGLVIGMLQCSKIPYTKIGPKKWQKEMWQGIRPVEIPTGKVDKQGNPKYKIDTKATSLIAVKRLFPNETFLATERSKKPHDGIVDAVLMAEYCRRSF